MSFQHGAGFRICGAVVRRTVAKSGKAAFLTLEVLAHPRSKKVDLRTFEAVTIDEVGALGAGMTVEVTGTIDVEVLKDRERNEIQVDGRAKFIPALTIRAIKIEGSSRVPAPTNGAVHSDEAPAATPAPASGTASTWTDKDEEF